MSKTAMKYLLLPVFACLAFGGSMLVEPLELTRLEAKGRPVSLDWASIGTARAAVANNTAANPEASDAEPKWARGIPSDLLKEEKRFETLSTVREMWWSPDGKWLASIGGFDRSFYIWDPATGRLVKKIEFRYDPIKYHHGHAAWSADGKWLAVAQGGEGVKLISTGDWQVSSINPYEELWSDLALRDKIGFPESVYFTPDSKQLIVYLNLKGGVLGHVAVWDTATWKQKSFVDLQPENETGGIYDERHSLFKVDAYSPLRPNQLLVHATRYIPSDRYKPWPGMIQSRNGKYLLEDPWVEIRNVTTGDTLGKFKPYVNRDENEVRFGAPIHDMVFDITGGHLAMADLGGARVSIWDVASGKRLRLLTEEYDPQKTGVPVTRKLAYSPDGRYLFGDGGGMPGLVLIWQLPDYRLVSIVRNFDFGAVIAFSPDSKLVALSSGKTICIHTFQR